MYKIKIAFILLFALVSFKSISQSSGDQRTNEVDRLTQSVIKHHLYDKCYIQMRPLPSVRFGTEDYIFYFIGKNWKGRYYFKNKKGHKKISIKKTDAKSLADKIEVGRLLLSPAKDSVTRNNAELEQGTHKYFLIICSNGKVRTIEYPIRLHYDMKIDWMKQDLFWHSDYMEMVLSSTLTSQK
ncbi:MAG: hypothetical protein ABIX01_16455 [Chitinophagaceae bacterium]